ncbi:MAG: hypothetical protein DLM59_10120 [Pseudonocardiales bacterium]|nr:MAG: hypothetical protein DLM59_10120 [Pseudonocardiales bacterium]
MTWTERTYHRRRRQEGLGRLTPPHRVRDDPPPHDSDDDRRLTTSVNQTLGRPDRQPWTPSARPIITGRVDDANPHQVAAVRAPDVDE